MAVTLNEVERRVFGVLLEKALAQPTYYPMTLNAIVAACNQKSNRDPVLDLDEDTVWNALERLRAGGFVSKVLAPMGARTDRFKHEAKELLGWDKPQRAVMAELLLRGPQTVAELRSRCRRMFPIESSEELAHIIERLNVGETPLVVQLPREPGQAAPRFAHTLYPQGEGPRPAPASAAQETARGAAVQAPTQAQAPLVHPPSVPAPALAESAAAGTPTGGVAAVPVSPYAGAEIARLQAQIDDMQAEIAELHEELSNLRRRFDALENELK